MHMNLVRYSASVVSNHINAKHHFWFYLQVFRQAGPPQEADCSFVPMGNMRYMFFPRNQKRLPVQESNRESATFRLGLLTRRSTY